MNETGDTLRVLVVGHVAAGSGDLGTALETRAERLSVVEAEGVDAVRDDQLEDVSAVVVADDPAAGDVLASLEQIRDAHPTVPLFVATESRDAERTEAALSAGATDVVALDSVDGVDELAGRVRARTATPTGDGATVARRWSDIASTVAHDAKNPLNVVVGRLDLMDLDSVHEDAVNRSVDRIESLLDDLSALGKAGRPVTDPDRLDVGEVAEDVWRVLDADGATLTVTADVSVVADPDRLEILFERLFENALGHGGDGVTVTVETTDSGFAVADDGPGVPPADRAHVLEQGYGTTGDGEGYGLFVASCIAESHGWTIEVGESEAGGARFEVDTGR